MAVAAWRTGMTRLNRTRDFAPLRLERWKSADDTKNSLRGVRSDGTLWMPWRLRSLASGAIEVTGHHAFRSDGRQMRSNVAFLVYVDEIASNMISCYLNHSGRHGDFTLWRPETSLYMYIYKEDTVADDNVSYNFHTCKNKTQNNLFTSTIDTDIQVNLMDGNNWRANSGQAQVPGQVMGGEVPAAPGMDAGDWRTQLPADSRQRIVNKIMETLKRHLPFSGQEGLQELKKIAVRFEEKTYTGATSQSDYLRKISLKMLTMETKSQNPMANSLQSSAPSNSKNPQDPASQSMQSQMPNQGQPLSIPMVPNQSQVRQQLLSQSIQNNMPSTGVPNSASLTPALPPVGGVSQATMPNVVGQNPNMQNLQNISNVAPNVMGNSMGQGVPSNMFVNTQRSIQGRQQPAVPQEQQQQSQNSQQYLYNQQLQQHRMKQKFQQGNISQSLMQSQIQQQQQQQQQQQHNLLQPTQIQSSQQAVMQPSLRQQATSSSLQQNQQSSIHQSTQPILQQQSQSLLRQQQSQQSSLIHQQQTSMSQHSILPTQQQQQLSGQQPNATSMQQNQLIGQQNNILDAQHQQQHQQRMVSQQNNHSNLQQQQTIGQQNLPNIHQQQSIAQQNSLPNVHQQQLGPQTNVSGFQQQQMVGIQPGNSGLQNNQQSVHMVQQSKVAVQQQMQQNMANLLPTQAQQSQFQPPQQQMMSQIQSQPGQMQHQLGLQQQANSLQKDMHQRIQTSGPLLQQHVSLDQQKQLVQSQRPIAEASLCEFLMFKFYSIYSLLLDLNFLSLIMSSEVCL
ncbi:unnamed protein product [Fraxinus pennsylvanica]|uniref:Mediator complex subunit 15 KIX domain-containing protein n=1 Tax=Fraxinus pennsylvanica TaxID=56036 RepID=A0AAD1ZNV5_9LAMI|nr:unnamed protein product [Fraxinus pennsylvanica]